MIAFITKSLAVVNIKQYHLAVKVVVTGGAGFIGSNFVDFLVHKYGINMDVSVLDSLTYAGSLQNIEPFIRNHNVKFFQNSINDLDAATEILKDVEIVFHFAAESHVDNSIENPMIFSKTNVMGTNSLLEACRINRVSKFIHISTDEVYGSTTGQEWDEESSLDPSSPYSASKASSDLIVLSYGKTFGIDVRVTRSCNNYGPRQHSEKLIPTIIANVLNKDSIPIFGTGRNFREWIYVHDNCAAIDLIAKKGASGEIYNIGSGVRLSNLELIDLFRKQFPDHEYNVSLVNDRPGHDFGYALNSNKIRSLGFKTQYSIEKGLSETFEWYKNSVNTTFTCKYGCQSSSVSG